MKKLNFLFIVLALVLTACSGDDDSNPPSASGELVGTWNAVDVLYSGQTVVEVAGQTIVTDFVGDGYDVDYTLTFSDNPNEYVSDGSYSIELTSTTLGQTQTNNIENLEFLGNGTWLQEGTELTITTDGETSVATILELTATSFKLGYQTVEVINNQGTINTSTIDLVSTYTRM